MTKYLQMTKHLKQRVTVAMVLMVAAGIGHATEVNLQAVQTSQVTTQDAQLKININPQQSLAPGSYTFELVVVDDSGNESKPARTRVVVKDNNVPVAVITAPQSVDVGKLIILDGSKSSDVGGRIVRYVWRLVN